MTAALPETVRAAKTPVEVWHQDEARVGQQGTLTYIWADKDSRPTALRDQRRQSACLFGAVCADRGVGAALVLPHANADAMSLHLAEMSRRVATGAHAVVVLDGAGWHQTGRRLRVPSNVSLLRLPPYSPELNPQGNVWQHLRHNQLANRVLADYDAIVTACCTAWNTLIAPPDRVRSITTQAWAKTVITEDVGYYYPDHISLHRQRRRSSQQISQLVLHDHCRPSAQHSRTENAEGSVLEVV